MKVRLYKTFSKRRNSTKQPGVSDSYTEVDVKLKEFTSVKNPAFALNTTDFTFEYAYIPTWNRYYFVADQISINSTTTEYTLEEDVLATNKTAIGNTVARIAFSSTGYDTELIDDRIAVFTTKRVGGSLDTSTSKGFSSTGCYALTVYNNAYTGVSNGFAQTYIMDAANIEKVKRWLGDVRVFQPLVDYYMGNPLDSIFGCIWIPFKAADVSGGTSVNHIVIGNQSSSLYVGDYGDINATAISGTGIRGYTATLPIHNRYTDFRKAQPYTTGAVYLPGIGLVDVNLNDWYGESNIYIGYAVEYATGNVCYLFNNAAGNVLQSAACNMASPIPIGQTTSNGSGMIGAITSAGGSIAAGALSGAAAGGLVGAGVGAAAAALKSAGNVVLASTMRGVSIAGNVGGRMVSVRDEIEYLEVSCDTEDCDAVNYIAQKGRPVALTHAINNHSGYVQCDNASVSIAGDAWERDEINAYLNGGFFYE